MFRICTTGSRNAQWRDAQLVVFPNELARALGCRASEFLPGVLDERTVVTLRAEESAAGGMCEAACEAVWQHPRLRVTRRLTYTSTDIWSKDGIGCRCVDVTAVGACDEADYDAFLGLVEARVRVDALAWRTYTRDNAEYVAVRSAHVGTITDVTRKLLLRDDCLYNVNVSFTDERGTASHRCVLFPVANMNTTRIRDSLVWIIVQRRPRVYVCVASHNYLTLHARHDPNLLLTVSHVAAALRDDLPDCVCAAQVGDEERVVCVHLVRSTHAVLTIHETPAS